MRRVSLSIIAVLTILGGAASPAPAVEIEPGLWELIATVDRDGTVSERPKRLRCVGARAADVARSSAVELGAFGQTMLNTRFAPDACRLEETRNGPDTVSWRLRCTGDPAAEQEGTARFDSPRHYTLTIRTRLVAGDRSATSTLTVEGRHRGECPR